MRIAVVCSDLGVRVPGQKGASLHLAAITTAFHDLGHEVLLIGVAGHGDPPPCTESLLLDHPGRSVGLQREERKLAFTERLVRQATPLIQRFAPAVVYERLSLFGTAGSRLADACEAVHIIEVNALVAEEESTWRGLQLRDQATASEEQALAHADLRVAVSREVANDVDRVAPGGRTVVVPNGVNTALFAAMPTRNAARDALGIAPEDRVIVFTGSLRPWHGVDVALNALKALPLDTSLLIAGTGDIQPDLERLATNLGISDRVRWLGHVPHQQMSTVLAAGDVAIAPYPPLAGFGFSPLKLYEYLAAGIPVVASDIGQVTEALADGRFGTLVEAGDAAELAVGIQATLADPASITRAERARAYALDNHGWAQRAEQILTQLAKISVGAA